MTLTKKQLAEARSISASHAATEKWRNMPEKDRLKHSEMMNKAKKNKSRLSPK